MSKDGQESALSRFFGFCKKALLIAGMAAGLSLAIWAGISLIQGRWSSPSGALLLAALVIFVIAMMPFFLDVGSTLTLPLRVWLQKRDARQLLAEDRPRSETGISLTFLFFVAGVLLLLMSFLAGRLFG